LDQSISTSFNQGESSAALAVTVHRQHPADRALAPSEAWPECGRVIVSPLHKPVLRPLCERYAIVFAPLDVAQAASI
jgi:hypothetical protein